MLAMALHCQEAEGDCCGRCIECTRIQSRSHPDVRYVEPLAAKKEIVIDQIRELERELRFRSFSGRRKVAILDPATLLNQTSQNALLKTLEEPPENSLLILIAPNAGPLLPTLRSRCLGVGFAPISRAAVAEVLVDRKLCAREHAELIAALSMGSLGAALAMAREAADCRQTWGKRLSELRSGNYAAATEFAEELASNRADTLDFLRWAQSWYRDLFVHCLGRDELVNVDLVPELERAAAQTRLELILGCAAQVLEAIPNVQRNLNRRMLLEQLLFAAMENE
jgi:DNA polymerase-3 subunit delta'